MSGTDGADPAGNPDPSLDALVGAGTALAVCAHPDDESFGLGAVIDHLVTSGVKVSVLCFTHGEASTLGVTAAGLAEVRAEELQAAGAELGVGEVRLADHPDGELDRVALSRLTGEVATMAEEVGADLVVTFDEGGVTGHPDHRRATKAALDGAPGLPVIAWAVPRRVTATLNVELGAGFVGRDDTEIDLVLQVDRTRQRAAIACHESQSSDNPLLWRRLELLGEHESLRWLRRPSNR